MYQGIGKLKGSKTKKLASGMASQSHSFTKELGVCMLPKLNQQMVYIHYFKAHFLTLILNFTSCHIVLTYNKDSRV